MIDDRNISKLILIIEGMIRISNFDDSRKWTVELNHIRGELEHDRVGALDSWRSISSGAGSIDDSSIYKDGLFMENETNEFLDLSESASKIVNEIRKTN